MKKLNLNTVVASALATAIAISPVPSLAKEEVSWWYENATPQQQEALKTILIDQFHEAYPDYDLIIDYRGDSVDQQIRVALLSGAGPDIVYTPGPSYVATMAKAGQLLPLDDYASQYDWNNRVLKMFFELGKYDGKLYALPKTYETLGLFYNKALFAEHGWTPPQNIDELEKLADEMLAKDIVPFGSGNSGWRPANEWQVSIVWNSVAGPENVYKALLGEIPWTSQPFVEAITALKRWWDKGYYGPDYFSLNGDQVMANLADGIAGMAPTGTWNFQTVSTYFDGRTDEVGFVGFPSGPGVSYPIYALGVGSTFSIGANAENPDGAAAVIDFVFSEKFYGEMNSVWQGEWNTPLTDLSTAQFTGDVLPLYVDSMRTLAKTVDANQYGYTTWTFLPPETNTYLVSGIEEVWFGNVTPEEFLATLDETFQRERSEDKVPAIPAR